MDELQNQGLQQQDGNPPEPSQNIEGKNPAPSQEDTGQLTDQQMQEMLPDQDERGVPAENVLGEIRRKIDKLTQDYETLKLSQSQPYQQPQQFQQPYQQPNMNQQPQQQDIVPRTPQEAIQVIDREVREKFGAKMSDPSFDPLEMLNYRDQRILELNSSMMRNYNSTQVERNTSEGRAKNLYPDLNNLQSPLARNVVNEIGRRASLMGIAPQVLYERDPYILESVTPAVAMQMGIMAKSQTVRIQPKNGGSLPPDDFGGKQTTKPSEIRPTQEDIAFGQRFGVDPKRIAKARVEKRDYTNITDDSDLLLS